MDGRLLSLKLCSFVPVTAIIPPDTVIAGGVRLGGKETTVGHNFLTGNPAGKREKLIIALQEYLDHRGDDYVNVNDLPADDPDHPDHVDFALPILTDHLGITDDGTSTLITVKDRLFIWDDGPNKKYLVSRSIACGIILVQENDPSLGGEDRYSLMFERVR